jgi:uncharacterized cupredoxin-like copper-binding protein
MKTIQRRRFVASGALLLLTPLAQAHTGTPHAARKVRPAEQKDWGIAGTPVRATRSVQVRMGDDMRFTPAQMQFKRGETVRFVVHNSGRVLHEFVIGTEAENAHHAQMMIKFPNMEHDEPWMAHVEPGRSSEITWTFNRAGRFEFACLIAGHYQAGMRGRIDVVA